MRSTTSFWQGTSSSTHSGLAESTSMAACSGQAITLPTSSIMLSRVNGLPMYW